MAIQFNCPYCTASIRVPDAAAGKRGTCPKCATQLIVPKVGPPPVPKSAPKEPERALPGPPPVPAVLPEGFPGIPADLPAIAEAPPIAPMARRKAKRKGTNPLIPLLAIGVVLGLAAYFMLKPDRAVEGELSGEKVPGFKIPAASIGKADLSLSSEEGSPAWEDLVKSQIAAVRVPDAFQMQFEPNDIGVNITIQKEAGGEVFRVKPNATIKKFFEQHGDKISRLRQKEYEEALPKFAADWETAQKNAEPFVTEGYFETVGLNRLAGVMGYGLLAQVGDRAHRAIHEDAEGRLYFLLPAETKEFVLKGRKLPNGETPFEGRFTVKVAETAQEPTPPESTEPDSTPEPMTEPMVEPEPGTTPEKTEAKTP